MKNELISLGLIPLDKSWIIRMGVLDLVNGYKDIIYILDNQKYLGEDLLALKRAINSWDEKEWQW